MQDKYINLFTDFGFKKIFGEEPNKDILIDFLNALLQDKEVVTNLTFLKNEQLGKFRGERSAVYDLYCENEKGERFIVEIQRVKQEYFKDRSLYYSTFAIQDQAIKGDEWEYELKHVYTIGVLDFKFDAQNPQLHHHVQLVETYSNTIFYDKLTFIYLEIPKFKKELHELENQYEKWLFAFKNLHKLSKHPPELQDAIFQRLFELAEIAQLDSSGYQEYQDSLKVYWDLKSSMKTYFKEGEAKGHQQGLKEGEEIGLRKKAVEIATNLIRQNIDIQVIKKATGLTATEIEELKKTLSP